MEGLGLGIGGKYNSHVFFMYLIQNNRFASLGSGEAQIIDNNDKNIVVLFVGLIRGPLRTGEKCCRHSASEYAVDI